MSRHTAAIDGKRIAPSSDSARRLTSWNGYEGSTFAQPAHVPSQLENPMGRWP